MKKRTKKTIVWIIVILMLGASLASVIAALLTGQYMA